MLCFGMLQQYKPNQAPGLSLTRSSPHTQTHTVIAVSTAQSPAAGWQVGQLTCATAPLPYYNGQTDGCMKRGTPSVWPKKSWQLTTTGCHDGEGTVLRLPTSFIVNVCKVSHERDVYMHLCPDMSKDFPICSVWPFHRSECIWMHVHSAADAFSHEHAILYMAQAHKHTHARMNACTNTVCAKVYTYLPVMFQWLITYFDSMCI